MDGGVGHTTWAPERREVRSQAGPKGRQLEVGPQRGPRLLVLYIYRILNIFNSSAERSSFLAWTSMVATLTCWSLDGRGETIPTSCFTGRFWIESWYKEVVLRYEELKQDQEGMVRKISDFIGFPLSEEQIQVTFLVMISTVRVIFNFLLQKLNEHMKFDNFQKASASNKKSPNW